MSLALKPTREQWKATEKARRRQKAEAAKAQKLTEQPAGRPPLPSLDLLTIADRQRCTRAMGIDMPMPEGGYGPQPDAFLSKQLADRFVTDLGRFNAHEERKRVEALRPGAFNAKTASPEDVRRRADDLGLDPGVVTHLAPVDTIDSKTGARIKLRPLDPPTARATEQRAVVQADKDLAEAKRIAAAMARGERIDMRRASAGVVQAYLSLRGVG